MRVAIVNMMHTGSTGKIMFGIAKYAREAGHEVITISPEYYVRHGRMEKTPIDSHYYFGFRKENMLHLAIAKLFGFENYGSYIGTLQLIRKLKRYKPEILHLHNIHNYTFHLPLLCRYLRENHVQVIWTLHDCWTMTGRCSYFDVSGCNRWQDGCHHCPHLKQYPRYYVDQTKHMWQMKRKNLSSIKNMILVTPSEWLANLTKHSYLNHMDIRVVNNGIDLDVFKPTISDAVEKYGISNEKKVVLGVAFDWEYRKGLDVFIKLAELLDETYQIVLVGTNDEVDKHLPSDFIAIHRTLDQRELAAIYTVADVFVNPTREDNFPTVNLEALACGTPVITFETGGSPEAIDKTCGAVVPCDDVEAMEREIRRVCEEKPFTRDACVRRATEFDMWKNLGKYIDLYREIADRQ